MKKGLLFDFNGTMFFDSPKHKEAWDVFSRTYRHKPITDDELDHMHGQTNKKIIEMLMNGQVSDEESEQLSIQKEAFYRECCRKDPAMFHLVPGLVELLDKLKEMKVPMTICSASIEDNIKFFIESFHLDTWFKIEDIIYDDGTHIDKVSMFTEGSKRIGVPLKDCMVIEDSLSGIQFAHQCQVGKIVAITTKDKTEEYRKLPGVDEIIYDYIDFDTSFFL